MKRPADNSRESGFTIVELLVTIIVGAILTTAINSMVNSHAYLSQRGRNLILANAFVEGKTESLRSTGFSGLTDGTINISSELPSEMTPPKSGTVVITPHTSAIKKVVISVTYNDLGDNRTYSYTTYIGELGVGQY